MILGFTVVSTPLNLFLLFIGTALGNLVGALPGLSSPMAIIVLLPLTYSMEPLPALLLMIGVYVGTKLGGSYSAILLRTPGTPAAACTVLDGYAMALQGKAGLALGYSTMGSLIGGLIGWVVAVTCLPLIAAIAIKSSAADIALVGILGLVMVSAFARGTMLKGLIGVVLGLLIATVGLDPLDATDRFTFGVTELAGGVDFAAALVGFFGVAVVLSDIPRMGEITRMITKTVKQELPSLWEMVRRWEANLIGSLYGILVGAVPGVGAESSTWLAYATVRNRSKEKELFGRGHPDGVLTPEASNNAVTGGTMLPLLTLGLPGDGSTAVMLGAMYLHGLNPGVTFVREYPTIANGMIAGLFVAHIFMFLIGWLAIKPYIAVLQKDRSWIFPFVLVLSCIGAYTGTNNVFPVYLAVIFGVLGYLMEACNFPIPTVVLGIILGPIIEVNVRLALSLSNNDWTTFLRTWPRKVMVLIIIGLVLREIWHGVKSLREGRPSVIAAQPD